MKTATGCEILPGAEFALRELRTGAALVWPSKITDSHLYEAKIKVVIGWGEVIGRVSSKDIQQLKKHGLIDDGWGVTEAGLKVLGLEKK